METKTLETLLSNAGQIIREQEQLEISRGETFNIFSVLNVETKEDATHSAFIGELLDPKGSHKMGTLFLELFLQTIEHEDNFEPHNASLKREYYISKVNQERKTGGRIDLLLKDKHQQTISIENKIYAPDQNAQIERYVNFNKSKNTVYYLTLFGNDPSEGSKGKLKNQTDYHCLSYSNDIIFWLEECQNKCLEKPIMRENIRQYILLLKKLTNQLTDPDMDEKIINLIGNNYKAAKVISNKIDSAELKAARELYQKISDGLSSNQEGWNIAFDNDTDGACIISLFPEGQKDWKIVIESGDPIHKKHSYVGIHGSKSGVKYWREIASKEKDVFSDYRMDDTDYGPYKYIDSLNFEDETQRAKLFETDEIKFITKRAVLEIIELKEIIEKFSGK